MNMFKSDGHTVDEDIKMRVFIPTSTQNVYNALMDEKIHGEFTGASAKIENRVGGTFSVWDGYANGENVKLVPGEEIVQSWRASDWPEGAISQVSYRFHTKKNGCEIEFEHKDVPVEFVKDIEKGWHEFYWEPLKKYYS